MTVSLRAAQAAALLWSLALAAPAFAGPKADFASCTEGKGCSCVIGHVDLDEYEVVTGVPAPEGAETMTLVAIGNDMIWSRAAFDELDFAVGGDGRCEAQLFNIVPQDGTWTGSVRVQKVTGCLPGVVAALPSMVDGTGWVRQIRWNGRFHPSNFVLGNAPDRIRWTALNATRFTGVFPVPQGGPLDIRVTTTATLTAPDRAQATLALRFSAAGGADAAALGMIGMANCRVDAIYDYARTGD